MKWSLLLALSLSFVSLADGSNPVLACGPNAPIVLSTCYRVETPDWKLIYTEFDQFAQKYYSAINYVAYQEVRHVVLGTTESCANPLFERDQVINKLIDFSVNMQNSKEESEEALKQKYFLFVRSLGFLCK